MNTLSSLSSVRHFALVLLLPASGFAANWNSTSEGNWNDISATGWNGAYPNAIGDSAIFSQNWGATKNFALNVDATIGALTLVNTVGAQVLNVTGTNTLTFDATGAGPASLAWAGSLAVVSQTPSSISAPITLNDDLVATGTTGLTISGNITGAGKKLIVNSTAIAGGAAQLQLSGNNSALTGGITVNRNSAVVFGTLNAMGGGGAGNVFLSAGSVGTIAYTPTALTMAAAIAKLDTASQGMFGISSNISTAFAIDLSGITGIRLGSFVSNYQLNPGASLTFDFANNGNKYAIGGVASNTNSLRVSSANILTGAHNLEVLPQNLILTEAQNYSGSTTLSDNPAGTVTGPSHGALNLASNGTILNTGNLTLNPGSILTINNGGIAGLVGAAGTPPIVNLADRVNDAAPIAVNGGRIIFTGFATGDSTETLGAISVGAGYSTFTTTFGGTNSAVVTAASLSRAAGQGTMLVNGVGLGKDSISTTNVARYLLSSAPTLVGTTDALSTGINAASKDTKIVPFLVGSVTTTTGGLGTGGFEQNTFMTWNATTGLRPLNPTDEFTNNALVSGNNIYITGATTSSTSTAINSLVINGNNLTFNSGVLTNTSGALLFTTTNSILGTGTLAFGSKEAIITATLGNGTISNAISGTAGLTKSGSGTLTLGSSANTYSGNTTVTSGTLLLSSTGTLGGSTKVIVNRAGTFNVAAKTSGFTLTDLEGGGTVTGLAGQAVAVSGHLTPGDGGIGTLTLSAGNLTLTSGATLDYEIAGSTLLTSNDAVTLTGLGSTVSLGGSYTLGLFNLGTVDPTGKSFVLFDSIATIAGAGTWAIDFGTTGWTGGLVSLNPLDDTQVILSNLTVVPEPRTGVLLLAAFAVLLARRNLNRRVQC